MAGTLAVCGGLGSAEVLGKLHAAGVPVVVEMGAPPSTAWAGSPSFCSRFSMARIDVRCWSMLCLSSLPTMFENRLRSATT